MAFTFHINDSSNPKVKAFLAYLKTLDFIVFDQDEHTEYPNLTQKQVLKQAKDAEKEIQQGKTKKHDQVYLDFKSW